MATAKKTAAPAKKTAKAAAPAAPTIAVGTWITFLGYAEGTPEAEQVLEANTSYQVDELAEGGVRVVIENPDYNPRKAQSDENAETIVVDVLDAEFEISEEQDDPPADEVPVETPEAEAPAPAPAAAKKTAPAKKAAEPAVVEDEFPELEGESEEVLAIVAESPDLLITAQELIAASNRSDFHLGGVLFHYKKSGAWKEIEKGFYKDDTFRNFAEAYLGTGGRKADNLIDIYVKFTQHAASLGTDPADLVADLGWAKSSRIASYFDTERQKGQTIGKLVKAASESTLVELNEFIQTKVKVGSDARPTVTKTKIGFSYVEEEGNLIKNILTAAAEALSLKDEAAALAHIVKEYGTNHLGTAKAGTPVARTAASTTAAPVASKTAKPVAKKVAAKA